MTPLKHLVFVTSLSLSLLSVYSQTAPEVYERKWSVVDSLINKKGLIESGRTEVNKNFALAIKEHNDVQLIKALVYRTTLAGRKNEDSEPAAINQLEQSMDSAGRPVKAILQNILACGYWN